LPAAGQEKPVGYLKVDYAGAEQIAATLRQNAEARISDINSLSSWVNPSSVWEGTVAELYLRKYEQWMQAEAAVVKALEELGGVVKQIVDALPCDCHARGAAALL
jgi:uncharacterized protein YukE